MVRNKKKICGFCVIFFILGVSFFFYYWWGFYLIRQGEVTDKPLNQFEDTTIENNYYPRPARPDHLFSINMSALPEDEAITMLTLAGMLARSPNGPQIYIEDDGGAYSKWKELITAENINITNVDDPWALVASVAPGNISGYILYKSDSEGVQQSNDPLLSSDTLSYEHKDESYCVAVSLCAIMNACVVEVADEAQAQAAGLTKIYDAQGKDVSWIFTSEYWPLLRHDMIFEVEHHTSRRLMLIDYAVFCGAPVWHAQTHDERAENLKNFEADSPSFGWGAVGPTDEAGLNLQVTVAGGFFMPSDWARDLSVFAAIPVVCEQKPRAAPVEEEKVHYVTIIMSDGDNLQWAMGGFEDPKFYGNSHRGEFAMGWTIPPAMADLCPLILRHYYQIASDGDRFVAGNSGHGLIYNSKHPWHEEHVSRSGPVLERADIDVVCIQDFGWQRATFEPTCALPGVTGVIYNDYRQYALQSGKCMWVNDKPNISFTYNFWIGFDSATGIAASINTASTNVNSPYAYSLIVVHAWSHGMDDVAAMVNLLGDDVRVVDPETFIEIYTKNVPHVDSYSISFMHFITLFGQYIGIALGIGVIAFVIKRVRKRKMAAKNASDSVNKPVPADDIQKPEEKNQG